MDTFDASDELGLVLQKAYDWAKSNNHKEVCLAYIIYKLLKRYIIDDEGEDYQLIRFFEELGLEEVEKHELINEIGGIIDEIKDDSALKYNGPEEWESNGDFITASDSLIEALKRSSKHNEVLLGLPKGSKISTAMFFLSVTWESGEMVIDDILSSYGLSKNTLLSIITENKIKPEERLEERRIMSSEDIKVEEEKQPNPIRNSREDDEFEVVGSSSAINGRSVDPESETPFLDLYSYDMSLAARSGKYDPVVGRQIELQQIIEILCCRKKNNVCLLGDPGCGKTAIIELLAQEIESGKVPTPLKGKRICSLDLNALVSGTKYRGEYEQRLQGIIKEVCQNPNIIVYIDEFHNLVGNGGSAGNGDGANILKPYLARGEFQCIGSTTVEEYRKWVEKDGALKRRFQNVLVDEPTLEQTEQILGTICKKYGDFHNVRYPNNVLKACVEWSGRYIQDRFFPDKAIDCLDMAGSFCKLNSKDSGPTKLEILTNQLEETNQKKLEAVFSNDFEAGLALKKIGEDLEKEIQTIREKGVSEKDKKSWPEVSIQDVAKVVSKISKVPIDKISESDMEKIKEMKKSLEKKVIGQDTAVERITISLQRNFLGLRDPKKPIASLLMVGPTGTGKTLICKEMAKEFFGSEKSLIKFDMAEFSERHEVTKLTGSTASYVGYDDTPLLEQVRRNPYSVVLFDEIEKAAPEIYNIFLSILDEGTVTLGNGQRVDFKNCIIVFTGNVGTKELTISGSPIGFGGKTDAEKKSAVEKTVMKAVEKEFRPEFINRLTSITVFNELHKPELLKIFDLEIQKLKDRLKKAGYSLMVRVDTKELCVSQCNPKYGARDLQRAIVRNIEDKICYSMLEEDMIDVNRIIVSGSKENEVKVEFLKKKSKTKKSGELKDSTSSTSEPKEEIREEEINK